jgi:hypothetical protein
LSFSELRIDVGTQEPGGASGPARGGRGLESMTILPWWPYRWSPWLLVTMFLYANQAVAGWQVETEIDRMTDKPTTWARLSAKLQTEGLPQNSI